MDRLAAAVLVSLLLRVCSTVGQTCQGSCGKVLDSCSCHATCKNLKTCCPDYDEYCVEILPYSGSILGGTDFLLLNSHFEANAQVVCRFNNETDTAGYVDAGGRGHCISPLLYQTGWVPFQVSSDNGATFRRLGAWLSVHTGKLDSKFKATLVNSTKWQYYGTTAARDRLEMTWNASLVRAERVNVELWGYRETGTPYSDSWRGEWEFLYSLAKDHPNDGSFSFLPKPAPKFSVWELGSVRVSPASNPDGARDVEAAWTEDHALAWHLEEKFRENPAAWALDKCLAWDRLETQLPDFLDEIADCPCTLAQARADTGRFHTDYGCDIEKGSVCTYHPGSVHCVRAIQASPKYAAGQQCCYDSAGFQVLTADSIGGSTPDRAHDWGSPPFGRPPRVPGQSHWVYDVLSFYYCCLWSDHCSYYFKHRPSSDCRRYRSPGSAAVFGDPHFVTFDGLGYSFNGRGEYSLVTSRERGLEVQGRTEPMNETIKATKLSAVAMREASSDTVEVRLDGAHSGLEVLRNQKTLSFREQTWMDLKGVFVFSPTSSNVTVMFPSGAGVEVRLREGTMTTTVLLPVEFNGTTLGLLGKMNGDQKDDLVLSDGLMVKNHSDPREIFTFGASWAVSNTSALFTYDSQDLLDRYRNSPRHDPDFIPVFSASASPDDPLSGPASEICSGEGSQFCRYDILVGRNPTLGNVTRASFESHIALMEDLKPVISCGWLQPPDNGEKEGTAYLQGAKVKLSCHQGFTLQGSAERVCQEDGRWSGEDGGCVKSINVAGIAAGSVIGAAALIVLVTTIVLHSRKQKRKKAAQEEVMRSDSPCAGHAASSCTGK